MINEEIWTLAHEQNRAINRSTEFRLEKSEAKELGIFEPKHSAWFLENLPRNAKGLTLLCGHLLLMACDMRPEDAKNVFASSIELVSPESSYRYARIPISWGKTDQHNIKKFENCLPCDCNVPHGRKFEELPCPGKTCYFGIIAQYLALHQKYPSTTATRFLRRWSKTAENALINRNKLLPPDLQIKKRVTGKSGGRTSGIKAKMDAGMQSEVVQTSSHHAKVDTLKLPKAGY